MFYGHDQKLIKYYNGSRCSFLFTSFGHADLMILDLENDLPKQIPYPPVCIILRYE